MSARAEPGALMRRHRLLSAIGLTRLRRQAGGPDAPAPLFIIGSGRSGNTLVRRVLMAGGEIFIPSETFVLGEIIEGWARGALLTWRERVWLFCAYFEKHRYFATFGLENLNSFAKEACAAAPEQRNLPALLDALYRHFAAHHGFTSERWGDKTPFNVFHLSALEAAFPKAQYLWLVRDGRDVALSYVEAKLFDTLEEAATRWVDANRACALLAARQPAVLRQSYEELVAAPQEGFKAICDWAGLRFEPAMLTGRHAPLGDVDALDHHHNVTRPISTGSIGRWRTGLDADELSRLPAPFWAEMAALGYGDAAQ